MGSPHPPTSSSVPGSVTVLSPAVADGWAEHGLQPVGPPHPQPRPFSLSACSFCLMRGGHALLPSSLAPGSSRAESRPAELGPDASVTASRWQELLDSFPGAAGRGQGAGGDDPLQGSWGSGGRILESPDRSAWDSPSTPTTVCTRSQGCVA